MIHAEQLSRPLGVSPKSGPVWRHDRLHSPHGRRKICNVAFVRFSHTHSPALRANHPAAIPPKHRSCQKRGSPAGAARFHRARSASAADSGPLSGRLCLSGPDVESFPPHEPASCNDFSREPAPCNAGHCCCTAASLYGVEPAEPAMPACPETASQRQCLALTKDACSAACNACTPGPSRGASSARAGALGEAVHEN